MAGFVDCGKYSKDQAEVNNRLDLLDKCCSDNNKKNTEQDAELKRIKDTAISADDRLLDKTGAVGGGKITLEKIKESIAGDVTIAVKPNSGLTGNGSKASPLGLNLGDKLIINSSGKLDINPNIPPETMTNIKHANYNIGMHYFTGSAGNTLGLPLSITSEEPEQAMRDSFDPDNYDFNGYYIASGHQLDVWLQGVNNTAWYIMNDSGVNPDGTLKDPNAWGKWQKLDNPSSMTTEQVKRIQDTLNSLGTSSADLLKQINALKVKNSEQDAEIEALKAKDAETCKVPIKHVNTNYTLKESDNTIITTNQLGTDITITIHNGLPSGRLFTIIQGSGGGVNLQAANANISVIAPLDGSLKLAGANAAVTVLTDDNSARVFGQTE